VNGDFSALRLRVLEHCRWIATFDREYAIWAYRHYRDAMPWLEL
jgi:hypothetical protein